MNLWPRIVAGIFVIVSATQLFAGGSGLNVVVVINTNSPNSLQLGNYYCEKRQVPPQNVLRINWTGGNVEWSLADYQNFLLNPLLTMLAERQLTNQIEYAVLSMDIPYRINGGGDGNNSTTSALFYGFKPDSRDPGSCPLATNSVNAYVESEGIFRDRLPISGGSNSLLATMITSSNLALAKQIVDQGAAADGTFPSQPVVLQKTTDPARNVRYVAFDNPIFNARVLGDNAVYRTNSDAVASLGQLRGLQTGLAAFSTGATTFTPGAMADSLTSYGGMIFESTGQTSLLAFLQAGAAGSYGTVIEPCNYPQKFPSAQNYFYQERGFTLAESYYQSLSNPYEGLIVGEPLAAPFAQRCNGSWVNPLPSSLLSGTTNLLLQFTTADATRPVQQVDLFLDGTFLQTLTNVSLSQDNVLYVTLPGGTNISYTVPASATIASVASGLADQLNSVINSNATKVGAFVFGDRIELRSTHTNRTGGQTFISASNSIGSGLALTSFIRVSQSNFLDTIAWGIRGFRIEGFLVDGDVLHLSATKTNGATVEVTVTNSVFEDTVSRIAGQLANAINATPALQGPDGLVAEDLTGSSTNKAEFNLRARTIGFNASQISLTVTGTFNITPTGILELDENLSDLQPRNHLYVTAGLTNLALNFPFDTTTIADGWHEVTVVAYEGSHVRTQKRIAQTVLVQNTPLSAAFNCLVCDTNFALEGTMQFSIVANTNTIARIELFSTGGSWGVATNQSSAVFSVAATNLQIGLHPFFAVVTRDDGKQYRTDTKWIRIVSAEPPFTLNINPAPALSWSATAGRLYEILSATNVLDTFESRGSLTATNSTAQWPETNNATQQFYRVRTQP